MRTFKKILRINFIALGILLSIYYYFFTEVDFKHYKKEAYYLKTLKNIDSPVSQNILNNEIKVGWSRVNITPKHPKRLLAYKNRGNYTSIEDSIFVKSLIFESNNNKVCLINFDLLMLPPNFSKKLTTRINEEYGEIGLYLTCSHTHNSIGQYEPGYINSFVFGDFDKTLTNNIINQTLKSIKSALKNLDTTSFGYTHFPIQDLVHNRLLLHFPSDSSVKLLTFAHNNKEECTLTIFSPHPTINSAHHKKLGNDYLGLVDKMIKKKKRNSTNFFIAGAVGSQSPSVWGAYNNITKFSNRFASRLIEYKNNKKDEELTFVKQTKFDVELPNSQIRVFQTGALRQEYTSKILGQKTHIDILQINDFVLASTPSDFSAEFISELDSLCKVKYPKFAITSFNGNYIGYLTPSRYYGINSSETLYMNWGSAFTGDYFTELISTGINKHYKSNLIP